MVTIVKYLQLSIFSITLSTKNARANSPKSEYKPVFISNTKNAEITITKSTKSKHFPTSIDEYFFIISAMMSVPPDVASHLNISAEPIDVSIITKISSKNGSSVTAASRGIVISKSFIKPE